jgi:hypothetical protein
MGGTIFSVALLAHESPGPIRRRVPLCYLGGGREGRDLNTAEVNEALRSVRDLFRGPGTVMRLVLPGGMALGCMAAGGAARHGSPRDCAERKARGDYRRDQRPRHGHHALNVVAGTPACKGLRHGASCHLEAAAGAIATLAAGLYSAASQIGQKRHDSLADLRMLPDCCTNRTASAPDHEATSVRQLLYGTEPAQSIQELGRCLDSTAQITSRLLDACCHPGSGVLEERPQLLLRKLIPQGFQQTCKQWQVRPRQEELDFG